MRGVPRQRPDKISSPSRSIPIESKAALRLSISAIPPPSIAQAVNHAEAIAQRRSQEACSGCSSISVNGGNQV